MQEPMDHDGQDVKPKAADAAPPEQPERAPSGAHAVEIGTPNTSSYRCYMKDDEGKFLSLWHDIPLFAEKVDIDTPAPVQLFNMVVEAPRFSNARLEVNHTEFMNPITHTHNADGSLSYSYNVFPNKGYPFNYGYFPQTWTDPVNKANQCAPGDGDLVDAIDVTQKTRKVGDVVKVKVLGATAFIVNNRLDWKIVCIEADDPMAPKIKEVHHLEFVMPGIIRTIHEFFFFFNLPTENKLTNIAFKGSYRRIGVANQILSVSHSLWQNIIMQKQPGIPETTKIACRQPMAAVKADLEQWKAVVEEQPPLTDAEPLPEQFNAYYYVKIP